MTPIMMEEKVSKAAEVVCKQGMIQFPVSETARAIVSSVVGDNERELDLIEAFREKSSQTLDQLVETTGLPQDRIESAAASLARKGLLFNQPSSAGVMVYRLLPLMLVGLMEYRFMGELSGSREEKELALLFEKLLDELRDRIQGSYDTLYPLLEKAPATDRTVPTRTSEDGKPTRILKIDRKLESFDEYVLPSQSVEEIIDKFDDIAVGHCFCRQRRSLLGDPCSTGAPTLNCFTFGKSARHTVAQGFARKVSREEALGIMQEAEQAGLVHKAFHPHSREASPETSICNCCKDCCDTIRLWRSGTLPLINSTFHLAVIDPEACSGCGVCEERCPTEAVALSDEGVAEVDENACFGCGICSRFCPEQAVALEEGMRRVFIMPPELRSRSGRSR
ncbi:MAG: 4Fe-4S binding protein [Deltaproteobacteria bacterium]|nr:4Fe-4S binding protein [Deltaproteobacteria bacterium]